MNCSSRCWMPRGSWCRMCSISIMGVALSRRCWPMKTSKKIPIAGVPPPSVGKSCGKLCVNGCGTCASRLQTENAGRPGARDRVGPSQRNSCSLRSFRTLTARVWPVAVGHRVRTSHGAFRGRGLRVAREREAALPSRGQSVVERSARVRMPLPSEPSTWPIRRIVSSVLCESSVWQKAAKGDRARRVSAVRRLLPPPAPVPVERKPVLLGPIRWVDVAGRALRRTWMTHWRRQYVEILPLADMPPSLSPPPRPPRAVRSHHRWSWHDRLACNAWSGPPHQRITVAGVPTFLASN